MADLDDDDQADDDALVGTIAPVEEPADTEEPPAAIDVPDSEFGRWTFSGPPAEKADPAEARRLIAADTQRPFDLEVGPLFRANLLRLGQEEHILLLMTHHIVSDGWSSGLLRRESSFPSCAPILPQGTLRVQAQRR